MSKEHRKVSLAALGSAERDRILARLIKNGGLILPDALYTVAEVARLLGRSAQSVRNMLDDERCVLTSGVHDHGGLRGKVVSGRAVLAYQESIRVSR